MSRTSLDDDLSARFKEAFDAIEPSAPPFTPHGRRSPRRRLVVAAVAGAVLVGTPAAAVGVHRLLQDRAFDDMGVPSDQGRPPSHLVLEQQVSARLTVRVFLADRPGSTAGKSGDCLFVETVRDGHTSGGSGTCWDEADASGRVVSKAQYLLVQLPADGATSGTVSASRPGVYDQTATATDGFVVLPPVTAGPLDLSYGSGGSEHVTVQVP